MAHLLATGLLLLALFSDPIVTVVTVTSALSAMRIQQPPRTHTGPTVPPPNVPLCDQEELITVASALTNLREKKLCQAAIDEEEMMDTRDPLVVCNVPACVATLQTMYATLPQCRFRDWSVQLSAEILLRNCAITPQGRVASVPDVTPAYDNDNLGCSPQPMATDAATPGAGRYTGKGENLPTQHDFA